MKIALAVVLNAALLAILLPWLRRQWQWAGSGGWRVVLVASLALRVGVGVARNWHPKADAAFMSFVGRIVTAQLWQNPAGAWSTLTRAVTVLPKGRASYEFVYQNTSNTWILMKILGVLNLATLSSDWLNALYLSLFAFIGCWQLVRQLADIFPTTPAAAGAVAFLLWPSVWFWATGISKEAVLLGSGAWLTAQVVGYSYSSATARPQAARAQVGWWLGTAALAGLHFGMRYFFAVPLLGVLGGVALGQQLRRFGWGRHWWSQVVAMAAVIGAGLWLAPQMSKAFSLNKFTNQVVSVYSFEVAHSVGRPHFEYPHLRPTLASMAAHAPLAVANALTRPWLGESGQPLYVGAGLENAALLVLLALAAWARMRGRAGQLPFGLGLGLAVFCITLAFLIGLTTPNLGTLNRYRSDLLPFLLLLLLQNDYVAAGLRRLGLNREPVRPA